MNEEWRMENGESYRVLSYLLAKIEGPVEVRICQDLGNTQV